MTTIDAETRAMLEAYAKAVGLEVEWGAVDAAIWQRVSARVMERLGPDAGLDSRLGVAVAAELDDARAWAIAAVAAGRWWIDREAVDFARSQAGQRLAAVREEDGELVQIGPDGSRTVLAF